MHVQSNRTRTRVHLYCTHSISGILLTGKLSNWDITLMCMVDHLTYLLNHWINFFWITLVICTTQWLRVEIPLIVVEKKLVPNVYRVFTRRSSVVLDRVILWDIYKSTFHLVYYASLLIFLLVWSVCPQYFKKLPIQAIILQICKVIFLQYISYVSS